MPSRLLRILLGALVVPVAVVLVLAVLILSVAPVGRYALSQVLLRGGKLIGAEVGFSRIEGNIMRSVTLADLTVKFGPDSLRTRRLNLTYDPFASIRHRSFSASLAGVEGLELFLSSTRPTAVKSGPGVTRVRYPRIRVELIRLSAASVYLDTVQRLDSIDLALNLVSLPTRISAQLTHAQARLCQERVSLRHLDGQVKLSQDSLIVSGLRAGTVDSYLRGNLKMAFPAQAVMLQLESLSLSLPEFTTLAGRVRLQGIAGLEPARGEGRTASGERLNASLRYAVEGFAWQTIELPTISGKLALADSVVLVTMAGQDPETGSADLSGRLDLRGLGFAVSARLSGVALRRFSPSLPDARADAQLELSGRLLDTIVASVTARIPALDIDRLSVVGSYASQVAADSPPRLVRAPSFHVERLELFGRGGALSGRGNWQAGQLHAELELDNFDLGLLTKLESLPVEGRVTGSIGLAGNLDSLDATVELSGSELNVAGAGAVSLDASLRVSVGKAPSGEMRITATNAAYGGVSLDSIQLTWREQRFGLGLWRAGVQVAADGLARMTRTSVALDVAGLRVAAGQEALTFQDALQLRLTEDSLDLRLVLLGIAGGDVRASYFGRNGQMSTLAAEVNHLDLAKLMQLLGMQFDLSGTVSLQASGTDTFIVSLDAEGLAVPSADAKLSRVQASATISRSQAVLDHLRLVHEESGLAAETSLVSGSFTYETEPGFVPGPIDLRARLNNPGPWILFFLKPTLELKQGLVYGDLRLKGSLTRPDFDGRVRISRAQLAAPIIGTSFERVSAELVLDRSRVRVEKLTGRSNQGAVLVNGFVELGQEWQVDSLRFRADFSGTTVNPQPEIYAVVGGNLDLDWALGRPFSVSGAIDVEEALLAFGFGQSSANGSQTPDTSLVFDIRVRGERDIWLRNQLVDIEFSGDLAVRKTLTDLLLSGELVSRQGTVYYLDHALRVTTGAIRFENVSTLNPDLNLTAEMPIRVTAGAPNTPDKVVLALTGTLEQPSFTFRTEPPNWDELEIVSYLTLNLTPDQITAPEMKDNVTKLLGSRLLGYFQNQVAKRARGFANLDYLEFESGFLGSKESRVRVGKYVGRNLYVSYTQNFTGDMSPLFRVEYYLNRKNEILAEGSTGNRYSLRYQLRFRY